jgi:hypothetical protein
MNGNAHQCFTQTTTDGKKYVTVFVDSTIPLESYVVGADGQIESITTSTPFHGYVYAKAIPMDTSKPIQMY